MGSRKQAKPVKKPHKIGQRGLQRKADSLFSQLVRSRAGNKCEYCGRTGVLHCHHGVVHRRYLNTRYVLDNCVCLCVSCHTFLGDFPKINTEFFKKRIGSKKMEELEIVARTINGKFDYNIILEKLK